MATNTTTAITTTAIIGGGDNDVHVKEPVGLNATTTATSSSSSSGGSLASDDKAGDVIRQQSHPQQGSNNLIGSDDRVTTSVHSTAVADHGEPSISKGSLVPTTWGNSVRIIGVDESKAAGLALAQAFANDPLSRYLVDGADTADWSAERRWQLHVDYSTYMTTAHCQSAITSVVGPDYDCVATWTPPHTDIENLWTVLRSGIWKLAFKFSPIGAWRWFGELIPAIEHNLAQVLGERERECFYIAYLGTKPGSRRQGYAGTMLNYICDLADQQNRPVYLESSSRANVPYYEKFGFEVQHDFTVGGCETTIPAKKSVFSFLSPFRDLAAAVGLGKFQVRNSPSPLIYLTVMVREPKTRATPKAD